MWEPAYTDTWTYFVKVWQFVKFHMIVATDRLKRVPLTLVNHTVRQEEISLSSMKNWPELFCRRYISLFFERNSVFFNRDSGNLSFSNKMINAIIISFLETLSPFLSVWQKNRYIDSHSLSLFDTVFENCLFPLFLQCLMHILIKFCQY